MGVWAVSFWFGEFWEQVVCTPHTHGVREKANRNSDRQSSVFS